ncbi:alpha/beta fold hydrolase [Acinetobacter bereziniae]|uniref:alpha/beta hydrolase family protein n=1 Tax=Acinetobacter bereziniae TaxID=106648 RepID=UPI0021CDE809|nr:alpha/beta fold hydrolase [Acinetobacter bereziniae]MCU4317678.1 alpha/beta fold hydrolase [Acinetobacter bereziniae]
MTIYENLTISCADSYSLSARFYPAKQSTQHLPVLVCPATGITQGFYHHFIEWLTRQGLDVMVFDFRGIGDSLYGPLSQSKASIQDWGQLDIPAAIESLLNKTGKNQLTLIGHSAGGQLLGIVPNYKKVAQVISISGSTGHVKGLKGRTKRLAPVMFNLVFPISNRIKGYGATKMLGMGENLPQKVAQQWAEFCSRPGYVINAVGKTVFEDYHHENECPITSYWSSDDEIATSANVKDLLRLYPRATTDMIELSPQQHGHKVIGHMSMFKKSHQNLWPIMTQKIFNQKL